MTKSKSSAAKKIAAPKKVVAKKSPTTKQKPSQAGVDAEWINTFNQLCFEVFFQFEKGQQLLQMLEQKRFYSPVAHPGKDVAWAHFNEGGNDVVRSFRAGANTAMMGLQKKKTSNVKRTRKA